MWTQKSRFGEFHRVDQSVETVCGFHGTVGILKIPKSSWSGFLLSCRDSKQFRVTELSVFSAVSIWLSGFQTIPEDGIIWFHCHTTRKGLAWKKRWDCVCREQSDCGRRWRERASAFSLTKTLRLSCATPTLRPSFFFPLGDLPRLSCLARQSAFCAVLMTRKLAPHAQALATRHSDSQCFLLGSILCCS